MRKCSRGNSYSFAQFSLVFCPFSDIFHRKHSVIISRPIIKGSNAKLAEIFHCIRDIYDGKRLNICLFLFKKKRIPEYLPASSQSPPQSSQWPQL